jgi:hypothetical protein
MDPELHALRTEVFGSFLSFVKVFYKMRTGRDFLISTPVGRESHYISIAKTLTDVFDGSTKNQLIAIPPRYGKTELVIHFVAWAMAHYPDSNFLYLSYNHTLATKQTQTIRSIIDMPLYRKLFGIKLASDSAAKDNFATNFGGTVGAAGAGGTITGKGAGIRGVTDRFAGCLIMDDMHKPEESPSDVIREGIIEWYGNTAMSRLNEPLFTPQIYIGQATHEHDLGMVLRERQDWTELVLPVLDAHDNPLNPLMHDLNTLLAMKNDYPYVFAAQYQQDPIPAGGGLFKEEYFYLTDDEPEMLCTFLTVDTAETDKSYNDATVFSFWGLYRLVENSTDPNMYGLHWIDCAEQRIEPKDLESSLLQFYNECCRYKSAPTMIAIEKKSTGVTLTSVLSQLRGLQVRAIERTKASLSKTARYVEMQNYIATKRISLPRYGKHTKMCIEHMKKITANNSHRHDDICDTVYDACKFALIDQNLTNYYQKTNKSDNIVQSMNNNFLHIRNIRQKTYGNPGIR